MGKKRNKHKKGYSKRASAQKAKKSTEVKTEKDAEIKSGRSTEEKTAKEKTTKGKTTKGKITESKTANKSEKISERNNRKTSGKPLERGKTTNLQKQPRKLSETARGRKEAEEWEDIGLLERLWQGNDRKRNILIVTGGVIVVIALLGLFFTIMEYGKSDRIYSRAQKKFVVILPEEDVVEQQGRLPQGAGQETGEAEPDSDGQGASGEDSTDTQPSREWYELASVDLEALQTAYPDVVGWILFENEAISYPIVYSGDNEKYLRTTYTGKSATAGSIFLDGESTPDFSDPHTLIYGHNMKNLSMFGRLRYYKTEKDYYEDHRYFQIFTGGQIYRYEIFAYEDISAYSDIYEVYGAAPEDILGLIRELKRNSYQDTGVEVGASDHIVTLSTCTGDGDVRMIVSAVRVDEHGR